MKTATAENPVREETGDSYNPEQRCRPCRGMFTANRRTGYLVCLLTMTVAVGISASRACAQPVVLFDEAHGERFLTSHTGPLDLSNLGATFAQAGWNVRTLRATIDEASLATADAVVISGAFSPLAPAETRAIEKFLARGGRLAVMLHIAPPVDELLHHLNVAISNGVIREREHVLESDPFNFRVTDLQAHALTRNLDGFNIYGGWALQNLADNVQIVARTSARAWIDLNGDGVLNEHDAVQAFGVVLAGYTGRGWFAVFGDDAMFQNRFLVDGNLALAKNLATWLRGSDTQHTSVTWPRISMR